MSKIAIDVVLFPDKLMADKAIEVSGQQAKKFNDKIVLHAEKCLPHISLAMGIIEEGDLSMINKILQEIAFNFDAFKLKADDYRGVKIHSGDIISEFSIKKIPEIQSLHEMIINKLKPFMSNDVSIDMLFSPPAVDDITLYWIKNYFEKSSFENFQPHITIGFGQTDNVKMPIDFTVSTLAICQLGNYCTCRKNLFSAPLKK